MEQLLVEQKAEIGAFNVLFDAFKKSKFDNVSVDDLKLKLQHVRQKFEIISNRNDVINQYRTEENVAQPYFAKNSFGDVQALFAQFTSQINEYIKQKTIRPRLTGFELPMDNPSASTSMSIVDMQKLELDGLIDMAAAIDANSQSGYVKSILNMMSIVWTELRTSIYKERADGKAISFDYGRLQQSYMEMSGNLNEFLVGKSNNSNPNSSIQFSLPKLQLPKFNGKLAEWKSFIALFDRMVHNNQKLDNGLKIEYLKTCIDGEACRLINHIEPTPENYDICYNILRKRFDNKREIMGQLLDNILNLPKMKSEDGKLLKNIHDTVYECMMAIQNIGISSDQLSGALLTHILTHKLDSNTVMHYECQLTDVREPQTLDDFLLYIENRFMALQSAQAKNDNFNCQSKKHEKPIYEKKLKCVHCNEAHTLYKCSVFGKKTVQERIDFAKSKKLCLNCFADSHKTNECKSTFSCKTCKKRHNSLLHLETKNFNNANQTKSNVAQITTNETVFAENNSIFDNVTVSSNAAYNAGSTMLATAIIGVEAKNKSKIALRALIDPGSQSSFITINALQTLNLKGDPITVNISGIAALNKTANSAVAQLTIFPRFASEFVMKTPVIVLKKLTSYDNEFQSLDSYGHLKNLNLADPSLTESSPIDIVLGADQYGKFVKNGLIKSCDDEPFAQNTEFGWIVLGPSKENKMTNVYANIVSLVSNAELNTQIDKFFGSDDFSDAKTMTEAEEKCEQHFRSTHSRNETGRYVVKHSFVGGIEFPNLGNSRKCAIATQMQLEKRFAKNSKLKADYQAFIQEFIELGQMELAKTDPKRDVYYLPHHCVFKESTTTKLRVVFNASQATDNGKSLNEQLAIGSIDQPEMIALLIKFRFYKYAFTADLEKMYRQILLDEDQIDLQRIVWRESSNEPFRDYVLKTIVYGTADAPYLATRTLKQLAMDIENVYPIAAKIIRACMYMDDVCSGGFSRPEIIKAYHELKAAFQSAGFNLRKWCSNSKELLNEIPECERELKACNGNVKALGICWSAIHDEFTFNHNIPINTQPKTKRALYSEISSLFDPLGWISPIIIKGKNLMQILWKQKVDWDTSVPTEILDTWLKIKSELHLINEIKIPRWVNYMPDEENELHGFCDASEVGYAAVIYVKNINMNSVSLLIAKAKVAPLKSEITGKKGKQKSEADYATIPRLELSGAELLANLTNQVLKQTQFAFSRIRLYTDSKIALGWINGNPKRFKTFVANKICKINDVTNKADWLHVSSENNPADCASRGILPSQLMNHPLWWNGPEFLRAESNDHFKSANAFQSDLEINAMAAGAKIVNDSVLPDVSSLYRMKRIIAYCQRFMNNCKTTTNKAFGTITATEMIIAERAIIRIVQNETFKSEFKALKRGEHIPNSSSLRKLTPQLDEHDIIRVGGRLKNAEISVDAKHPIVLPKCNAISSLIIREAHLYCMHGGPRLTEATLRQKFWILNSQHEIKKIINNCVICFRQRSRTMNQTMAHLPKNRVNMLEKPFTNTAVDYTGAFDVKTGKGRGFQTSKAYICIFACMATKAIHAELVSDLSAETYIAAFRRLVAIRGMIKNLYSDNGTCFVRADKDLQQLSEIQQAEFNTMICNELTKCGTNWHFSPPGAPHFNGLAEAAVKSVKTHLKKTIGQVKFTYEEFATVLRQVEACVNSRPLCAMSSDPNDLESITPGHFLIGGPLLAPPDESFIETNVNWLSRWQLVQKTSQVLWKRFQSEYLTQLQERSKWFEEKAQPKINELVLIKEENVPPCQWPMARIVNVHKGDDDLTRVVTVKMRDKIFKRPITKLAPLPIENDDKTQRQIQAHLGKIHSSRPKFKFNVLPVIVAMLSVFVTTMHALPMQSALIPFTITRFDTPPGLYFEQQSSAFMVGASWNVIAFINIRGLHDECVSIRSHVSRLRDHCFEVFYSGRNRCNNVVTHLEDSVERLNDVNDMIFNDAKNRIAKRAVLDPVGNLFGDVFGILDSRFRSEYQHDLRKITANENHLTLLMKNHTSILESTLNILKNEDSTLTQQNKHIVTMSNQIKQLKNATEAELIFNNAITYVEHLLAELKSQQDAIIEILWHAEKKSLNHNLFTPKQVKQQGEAIAQHVGAQFLVPMGADIYRVSEVKPFRTANQLIFKITIPLLNPQKFKIFKIIQVPRLFKNELWWIYKNQMEKFLISAANREKYQIVEDLNQCKTMNDDIQICNGPRRWIGASSRYCIWNLFNQNSETDCQAIHEQARTVFIELAEDNRFIFVCDAKQQLTVICGEIVLHPELEGEGIISINDKCRLKTLNSEQEILTKFNIDDKSREIILPKFPHFVVPDAKFKIDTDDDEELEISTNNYNFTQLFVMLNETKLNTKLPNELNVHDIHHYTTLYLIVIVMIVFISWYCITTKIKRKQRNVIEIPIPAPRRMVSMPDISTALQMNSVK